MKKAFTLAVLIAAPGVIFAQGTVVFNNLTGLVRQWTSASDLSLVPVPVGGGYVQLIAAAKGNPLLHPLGVYEGSSGFVPRYSSLDGFLAANPAWAVPDGALAVINLAPGHFDAGEVTTLAVPYGAYADYLVVGWNGPYATYDAAYAEDLTNSVSSFLGMSAIATTPTGDPTSPGVPGVPISLRQTFQGMTLAPAVIPEPSTVFLAVLGAVLLLVFHRRADIPVRSDFQRVPWPGTSRSALVLADHWGREGPRAGIGHQEEHSSNGPR